MAQTRPSISNHIRLDISWDLVPCTNEKPASALFPRGFLLGCRIFLSSHKIPPPPTLLNVDVGCGLIPRQSRGQQLQQPPAVMGYYTRHQLATWPLLICTYHHPLMSRSVLSSLRAVGNDGDNAALQQIDTDTVYSQRTGWVMKLSTSHARSSNRLIFSVVIVSRVVQQTGCSALERCSFRTSTRGGAGECLLHSRSRDRQHHGQKGC